MTFTVMVLHTLGTRLTLRHRLYLCEDLNRPSVGEVRTLTKAIILAVLAVEAAGTAALALRWVPEMGWAEGIWFSLFHAVSATNNAGFALRADGMAPWAGDPLVNIALPLLFIVGGLGFGVLADLREERRWARLSLHTKLTLAATGVCLLIGPAAFALLGWSNPRTLGGLEAAADRLWAAWFQGTSIRTAGFASVDHAGMTDPTWLVSVILMLIDGDSTSTVSGVKVTTAAVALRAVAAFLRRRQAVVAFGRTIPPEDVAKVTALILRTFALCFLGTFLLTALDGILLRETAFEAVSALSTTDASFGATTATGTAGRIVLIALMPVGNLGPLTAALLLTAPKEAKVKPPPGRVFIG